MIVLDTHVVVGWVSGAFKVSARAKRAIDRAIRDGPAVVSTISVLEIATAVRRGRLDLGSPLDQWLADLRLLPELRFEPVSFEVARLAAAFDDSLPGDPADRIIASTAVMLRAKLITADARLRRSAHVQAVW
jgi:PIN domain nuclease of toxin-antitoxin system